MKIKGRYSKRHKWTLPAGNPNGDYCYAIGYIDGYDAIHYKKLRSGDELCHEYYWPTQMHRRWRFIVADWKLEDSILSGIKLNSIEADNVLVLMRKIFVPPDWFLQNEAWDAAGRPRGDEYDKFLKNYELKKTAKYKLRTIKDRI